MSARAEGRYIKKSPDILTHFKDLAQWYLDLPAGHDYFRIMAATGHKTMEVFKRYNTVSRDELKALVNGKTE